MAEPSDPAAGHRSVATRLRRRRSVRVRITLAAVLVTAAAMAATGWMLVRSVGESQLNAIRNHTEDLLDKVTERLADGDPPRQSVRDYELTTGFVRIVDDGRPITFVPTLGDARGDVPAGPLILEDASTTIPEPSEDDRSERSEEVAGATPQQTGVGPEQIEPVTSGDATVSDVPLEQSTRTVDTPSGEMTVTVAAPIDQVAHSLDAVRRALTIGLPLLVALVALATWRIVSRALRPVELIRAEADAIGATTLHRRLPEPDTGDEVDRLSRTMNAMLERLEGAVTRQRQFVADASHELRNPVAGIRTDLEAALCEGNRADWPTVAREVLDEEARLETLIGDLLVLAAEDEGTATLPDGEVALNDLVTEEASRRRGVTVSLASGPDGLVVAGSHGQLRRALANLVDNAQRHARSQVRIGAAHSEGSARLWVDDDGPGMPPEDRDRVFERFTRLDDARSRDQGGSGLGLAVVRSIVTRHGGRVRAEDSPLGGARVVIVLPALTPAPAPTPSTP